MIGREGLEERRGSTPRGPRGLDVGAWKNEASLTETDRAIWGPPIQS